MKSNSKAASAPGGLVYSTDSGRMCPACRKPVAPEDVVHASELGLFAALIGRAAAIQLPVMPLPDPTSPWIAGHYCDEFAENHGKEPIVRETVGAAIPLAGVACAIERGALSRHAEGHGGRPFATDSMTEDYEIGLRLGAVPVPAAQDTCARVSCSSTRTTSRAGQRRPPAAASLARS